MHRIYMVVNQENGKIYIGQTIYNTDTRWKRHIRLAISGKDFYFYRAIRKHGPENFTIKQIDCTENEQEANELEKAYIGIFKAHKPKYGYNSTLGGENGTVTNPESIEKIRSKVWDNPIRRKKQSEFMKNLPDELRRKFGAARKGKPSFMKGKKHSEETKLKMKISQTGNKNHFYGKHHTEETKRKISEARRANSRNNKTN